MEEKIYRYLEEEEILGTPIGLQTVLKLPGVKNYSCTFFCYCAIEVATGLWSVSFMEECKGVQTDKAAMYTSLFYFGMFSKPAASSFPKTVD